MNVANNRIKQRKYINGMRLDYNCGAQVNEPVYKNRKCCRNGNRMSVYNNKKKYTQQVKWFSSTAVICKYTSGTLCVR